MYSLLAFSFLVWGSSFSGSYAAYKLHTLLLLLYMALGSVVFLLLIIFCGVAFQVANDREHLVNAWNGLSAEQQDKLAERVNYESLPHGADDQFHVRELVIEMAGSHLNGIAAVALITAILFLVTIWQTYTLRGLIWIEMRARLKAEKAQAAIASPPQMQQAIQMSQELPQDITFAIIPSV